MTQESHEAAVIGILEVWRNDPVRFCLECLDVKPSNQQLNGLQAVGSLSRAKIKLAQGEKLSDEERVFSKKLGISIKSGHGTGKDAFLAWVYLWLMVCFPYPKGLVTAPTSRQLKDVLWGELSKWLRGSKVYDSLVWQSDRIFMKDAREEWFLTGRTANVRGSEEEQGETLAGMHGDYMILAVDEASGVPNGVFRPLEGAMTGKMNFAILISNPTRGQGYFFDTHNKDRGRWVSLSWNSEQSNLVSQTFIEGMVSKYGKESNMYRVRVLGDFPLSETDALIPLDWILDATDRDLEPIKDMPLVFGLDVARHGNDKSVLVVRKGNIIEDIISYNLDDTMDLVGRVSDEIVDRQPDACFVDMIGMGYGVHDRLKELHRRVIRGVNVAEKPSRDKNKYKRLRDQLWWELRELFEQRSIKIPADDELIGELSNIKYKYESDSKIKIESKADMKARGVSSPNKADALCLSFVMNDRHFVNMKREREEEDNYRNRKPEEYKNSWMVA